MRGLDAAMSCVTVWLLLGYLRTTATVVTREYSCCVAACEVFCHGALSVALSVCALCLCYGLTNEQHSPTLHVRSLMRPQQRLSVVLNTGYLCRQPWLHALSVQQGLHVLAPCRTQV
jgi:hypothetical protein